MKPDIFDYNLKLSQIIRRVYLKVENNFGVSLMNVELFKNDGIFKNLEFFVN